MSRRAAEVWDSDACWSDCTRQTGSRFNSCTDLGGPRPQRLPVPARRRQPRLPALLPDQWRPDRELAIYQRPLLVRALTHAGGLTVANACAILPPMLHKLAARARTSEFDLKLVVPLLLVTVLTQIVTAIIRITTSYRALELNLSIAWLGVIAAFAILPIVIAVPVGFIDRGHDARTVWMGAGLWWLHRRLALWSTAVGLFVVTTIMGIGHTCLMASQQMLCVRAAEPRGIETVFGNYMVAGAIGQGVGPYVVGWAGGASTVPPTRLLFIIAFAAVSRFVVMPHHEARRDATRGGRPTRRCRSPTAAHARPAAVIVAGVVMISASDIILIYVPLLGAERPIDVSHIGLLLTVRAAASMVARLTYARMVAATAAGH